MQKPTCKQLIDSISNLQLLKVDFDDFLKTRNVLRSAETKRNIEEVMESAAANLEAKERHAEKIMGMDFMGPRAVEKAFGIELKKEEIPPIPFTIAELKRAKELGQMLVLRVDKDNVGGKLSTQRMYEILSNKFFEEDKGLIVPDDKIYDDEYIFDQLPRAGWALVSKDIVPGTTNRNFLEQTDVLARYLEEIIFLDEEIPGKYKDAIDEYEAQIQTLFSYYDTGNWEEAEESLLALYITKLCRPLPVEVLYDLLVYFESTGKRLLQSDSIYTGYSAHYQEIIAIGQFTKEGILISELRPDESWPFLGAIFSRRA